MNPIKAVIYRGWNRLYSQHYSQRIVFVTAYRRFVSSVQENAQPSGGSYGNNLTPPSVSVLTTPPEADQSDSSSNAIDDFPVTAPSSHVSPSFMNDPLAMKFINSMMRDGKKSTSQKIFRMALENIKTSQLKKLHSSTDSTAELSVDPMLVFHTAVNNVMPTLGTRPVKKGGRTYQVPVPLNDNRRRFLSLKWLIMAARERPGPRRTQKMPERLAAELLDAYNNQGTAVKRKQDMNRLAEANRAFVHFRW